MSRYSFFSMVSVCVVVLIALIVSSCGGKSPAPPAPSQPKVEQASPQSPAPEQKPAEPPKVAESTAEQPTASAPATLTGGKPKIVCDNPTFEFGERSTDEKVEHEFIVRNAGDAPLEIIKVRTSCGCTVAQPEEKVLQPGQSTKIKATLTLAGRQGPMVKTVTVESNDPETPQLNLELKGTAVSPITVEPRTVNFGSITEDIPPPQTIEVKSNMPNLTFHITNVDVSQLEGLFESKVETIEDGKQYKITLTATKPIEPGKTITKSIFIETDAVLPEKPNQDPNAVKSLQKIPVTIYGRSIGALDLAPETITVRADTENPNSTTQQYLRLKGGREKVFKVQEVIPPIPEIEVEVKERAEGDYLLLVKNIPQNESINGKEIIVKTTAQSAPEVKIPIKVIKLPEHLLGDRKFTPPTPPRVPGERPSPTNPEAMKSMIEKMKMNMPPKPPAPPQPTQTEQQSAPEPAQATQENQSQPAGQ